MKNKKPVFIVSLALIITTLCMNFNTGYAQDISSLGLIPAPSSVILKDGYFKFTDETLIIISPKQEDNITIANYLTNQTKLLTGIEPAIKISSKSFVNSIILTVDYKMENPEAYTLQVAENNIIINGNSKSGLFYGVQTLLQLIYPKNKNTVDVKIPAVEIADKPVFKWRGMHLDVSRHFYSVSTVKKMLDAMANLKLNTFHWHLTDDQGWRIEIKRYPGLTETGAWRNETMVGHYTDSNQVFDGMRYGGYYTQDEIKEVVNYAQSRFITVVPEIEMPGHAVAALSAYPEYSCTGGPFDVYTKWGVSKDVYCAGKDETFEFLENILDEVAGLFPGRYIHIGGDECPKARWKECAACQKRIKDEGLKDEFELQSYFIKRIEKHIAAKGKKLIGWDEILEGGLPERATVMSWRGYEGGIEAAHTGHDVIMTPGGYCYFDHYQGKPENEPLAFGGFLPLEKVYSFNPVPPTLSAEGAKHILGAQANVWTEYITNENKLEYMVFPRLCAMAEILWTPKEKQNYQEFQKRLEAEFERLEKYRVNYRPVKQ